jgi:predicted small integral membrane protein
MRNIVEKGAASTYLNAFEAKDRNDFDQQTQTRGGRLFICAICSASQSHKFDYLTWTWCKAVFGKFSARRRPFFKCTAELDEAQ